MWAFERSPVRITAWAASKRLLRTVRSCERGSAISKLVTRRPSRVMFAAGLKSTAIVTVAPGAGSTVTIPTLIAPRNVP